MGQAKRRGSREDRVAQARERDRAARVERDRARDEEIRQRAIEWEALPDAEKRLRLEKARRFREMMSGALRLGGPFFWGH